MKLRTIKAKLPKSIRRITVLKATGPDGSGEGGRMVIKKKRKKKKQSKGIVRIFERAARSSGRADRSTAEAYLSRHRRSNKKRRDGWLRDFAYNTMRANRKGSKKFKLSKLF